MVAITGSSAPRDRLQQGELSRACSIGGVAEYAWVSIAGTGGLEDGGVSEADRPGDENIKGGLDDGGGEEDGKSNMGTSVKVDATAAPDA